MNMTLTDKLTALKIPGDLIQITDNTFYTCYHVEFRPDITISKVTARIRDLELFFNTPVIIDTCGGSIVIKAQKDNRNIASTEDLTRGIKNNDFEIPLIIGMTADGIPLYYDLTKCPHILAGGSTGSGKSVFINNLILSTFYNHNTALMLIDVKRVEFSIYEKLPRLCHDIAYTAADAMQALKTLCYEMDSRYKTLQAGGYRNIIEYRNAGGHMDYIACFIDELADLILTDSQIESYIIRLAQLGRAAGIHLVVATQRPDSKVISGLIRSNIPTRVCFSVQKATDSRIILDTSGGEKLRGKGDGLFYPIGAKNPLRFQAPFIDTDDIKKLVKKQIELSQ